VGNAAGGTGVAVGATAKGANGTAAKDAVPAGTPRS
jgi:hypothetical protein